jgi:ABC-type bacteriocin/lantibiotic exporter with double-glycine peptidase domain
MSANVPLLKQWDERWADYPYGSSTIAVSGCGPTCFAMIAIHYGINILPPGAADFAVANGYYPSDGGTSWDFFAAAGQYFGVPMHQTDNPEEVRAALKRGAPCIGAHGPGEFTEAGHFLVYAYITQDDQVMIHDPNREETCKLYPWDFLVQDNTGNTEYVAFVPGASRQD